VLNILNMPRERWEDWLSGYATGYLHGLEAGRTQGYDAAETTAQELWRRAYRIVQAHARIDSHQAVAARVHRGPVAVSSEWPELAPAEPKDGQEGQVTDAPAEPPPSSLAVFSREQQ
jgi:hypothetical protein